MKRNLDVEKNLRSIGLKAKNALKKCDKKIGDIAESMGLPSDVVLRTMDATNDVRMMHLDTLIRLFHACGYTVDISITEKPADDESDAPPVKPRKKKNDVPVVKFKDEIADPKEIAKREKAEARSKKKVGTSRSKKKKVTR